MSASEFSKQCATNRKIWIFHESLFPCAPRPIPHSPMTIFSMPPPSPFPVPSSMSLLHLLPIEKISISSVITTVNCTRCFGPCHFALLLGNKSKGTFALGWFTCETRLHCWWWYWKWNLLRTGGRWVRLGLRWARKQIRLAFLWC